MKIKHILVSQPAPSVPEKAPFHEIVEKHKAVIEYMPFINVVGVSLKEFRSQRVEILSHTAVIFTNRTTVDSFFRICEQARVTVPETMKYFCNTEAIALYLQKYIIYRKRKIFFADGKFDSFMGLILKHKDEKFLLTLTEPHKGDIPDTMTRLKLKFSKVILAKTVSAELEGVEIGKYDLLVFYSPAEIEALVSAFGVDNLPLVATFGNGTACAADERGVRLAAIAPTPEAPSMAKAVELLIKHVGSGKEIEPVVVNGKRKAEEFIKAQEAKPSKRTRLRRKSDAPAVRTSPSREASTPAVDTKVAPARAKSK